MEETLEQTEKQHLNKLNLKFTSIYKAAYQNSGFTVMFSGIISLCIILLYALFSLVYDAINVEISLSTLGLLIALIILAFLTGLILPFLYSYFACYHVLNSQDREKVKLKSFFKTYLIGTSRPIRSALSNFKTILISFLIYTVINFIGLISISIYATNSTGPLHEMYLELSAINVYGEEGIGAIQTIISNYEEALRMPTLIVEFFSLIFSLYYYIHTIARNTFKYFFAMAVNPNGEPQALISANYFFKSGMRGHFVEYHQYFYKILWPATLLYFAGFSGIYFSTSIYLNSDLFIASLTALVVPLVLLTLFLPILFELHSRILSKFERYFFEFASKDLNIRYKEFAMKNQGNSEEKEIQDELKIKMDEFNKYLKELDEAEKETDEEDDKKED